MGQIINEAVINMPRAAAWEKLRDLRTARNYVPGVRSIEFNPGQREGVGASRRVVMKNQPPVDETAIAWDEGHGFTLKIHNGEKAPAPFKSLQFRYAIEDAEAGQTRLRCTISYEMGGGLIGKLLEAVVIRPALQRSNTAVATNLKTFYETGRPTNTELAA